MSLIVIPKSCKSLQDLGNSSGLIYLSTIIIEIFAQQT